MKYNGQIEGNGLKSLACVVAQLVREGVTFKATVGGKMIGADLEDSYEWVIELTGGY